MADIKRSALIVATGEYLDSGLQQLIAPPIDAEALTTVLENPKIGGFGVKTLLNSPSHEVGLAIEDFFADRHTDDLLLLHLSCHGIKDDDGELYFATANTSLQRLLSTSLPAHHVNRCMSRSRSRRIVLLLDCCYAGAFQRGMAPRATSKVDIKDRFDGRGRAVITASSAIESAFEGGQLADARHSMPSIFTSALVEGLATGDADIDQDGVISLDELYDYIFEKVRTATPNQTPEKWIFGVQGELIIAQRARPVTIPAPLPIELNVLMDSPFASARAAAVEELERLLRSNHGGISLAAHIALKQLMDDDSRSVSTAASTALKDLQPGKDSSPSEQRISVAQEQQGEISNETLADIGPRVTRKQDDRHTASGSSRAESLQSTKSTGRKPGSINTPGQKPPNGRAVGIDLGTTNSSIAVIEGGEPTVIANAEGSRTTPSVVAFTKDNEVLVGEVAKRQADVNPDRTIRSIKREMGSNWSVTINGKKFTPQQISAFILQKLKRDAEAYLGETITDVVITVPTYFGDAQRQATKEAGQIAGLNVLRIINEPTSAALAYHLEKENEATILVFDLGGGSLSASLINVEMGVVAVVATSGDNHLGGDDWDQRIVDWLVQDFKNNYGIDLAKDKMALQRLREAAERAKIELSSGSEAQINLPNITQGEQGPLHLDTRLSRSEFQRMTSDLLDRCKGPIEQVLKDAGIEAGEIDQVLLSGGATHMPAVTDLLRSLNGRALLGGIMPDEVVAAGASLQAGVLKGEVKEVLPLDVTPLSLGIETKGGIFTKLIERNTTIPTKRSEIFTTANDNQPSIQVQVFQGEREIAAYNKKLGMFELSGIAPARRGVPQIEVAFDIDANGIVNVSAKDLGTGKQQSVTISGGSALAKDDIDKMVRDAKQYAKGDRQRREEAEVRNRADAFVNTTEKSLAENAEKVPDDIRSEVESALADVKKALENKDTETIREVTKRATRVSQKIGIAVYKPVTNS